MEGNMQQLLEGSLHFALARLKPAELVRPHLPEEPPSLIMAVGKAALPMLHAALQDFPTTPWLAVPPVAQVDALAADGTLADWVPSGGPTLAINRTPDHGGLGLMGRLVPGSHPSPDEASVSAGAAALAMAEAVGKEDNLLLLLSGGGSSLLCAPHGVTLEEKRAVADALMRSGADVFELNTVRKHLSRVKGGRLAAATQASVLNLVISDVLGDDLSVIASGVAAPDESSYFDALSVLDKYDVPAPAARQHFKRGVHGQIAENPRTSNPVWERVKARVIGSNRLLLQAAKEYWEARGYPVVVLSDRFGGEAKEVAAVHAAVVRAVRSGRANALDGLRLPDDAAGQELMATLRVEEGTGRPIVLLSGGEATVKVAGSGRGGRNQEFALWLLKYLGPEGVWGISAGSDGIDGNSEAAGALLSPDSFQHAEGLGLVLDAYLERNDSFAFFQALGRSVVTGHTGNNLNDYRALVVERQRA